MVLSRSVVGLGLSAVLGAVLSATFACVCDQANVCNIGAPCPDPQSCSNGQNATCETTLWHGTCGASSIGCC